MPLPASVAIPLETSFAPFRYATNAPHASARAEPVLMREFLLPRSLLWEIFGDVVSALFVKTAISSTFPWNCHQYCMSWPPLSPDSLHLSFLWDGVSIRRGRRGTAALPPAESRPAVERARSASGRALASKSGKSSRRPRYGCRASEHAHHHLPLAGMVRDRRRHVSDPSTTPLCLCRPPPSRCGIQSPPQSATGPAGARGG